MIKVGRFLTEIASSKIWFFQSSETSSRHDCQSSFYFCAVPTNIHQLRYTTLGEIQAVEKFLLCAGVDVRTRTAITSLTCLIVSNVNIHIRFGIPKSRPHIDTVQMQ